MVAIWRHLPSLRDPSRFEAWAHRTLVRQGYREGGKRRFVLELDLAPEPVARDEVGVVADRDLLERAFLKLSVDHRAVVVLRHYAGMSMEQVADSLDIPLGTANSRLSRAMTKLREALEADEAAFGPMGQEVTR